MYYKHSTYIFDDITYYFSPSYAIDCLIGKHHKVSMQGCINELERGTIAINSCFSLFASLFIESETTKESLRLVTDTKAIYKLIDNDGLKLLFHLLMSKFGAMQEKDGASLENYIILKTVLNILYILIYFIEKKGYKEPRLSLELNQLYRDFYVDNILMKMVTLSLEAHYIPIKKLTMLYTRVLANIFHHKSSGQTNITRSTIPNSTTINPIYIYHDEAVIRLPSDNLLKTDCLYQYKRKNPPTSSEKEKQSMSSIEYFYRKHNMGDCPLAQSIVVGLLRSLLTICNCQVHKKFQTIRDAGVDSFRYWQLSYRYVLDNFGTVSKYIPQYLIYRVQYYDKFDKASAFKSELSLPGNPIYAYFYMHKIYTTSAITTFFMLILLAFKENMFIQFSYFLQLISDANGILVFLKFLTEKFSNLYAITSSVYFTINPNPTANLLFKYRVMLTIFGVLNMLHSSCNNYPEKIRNYLFEYNSYLIIKKIPNLFIVSEPQGYRSAKGQYEPSSVQSIANLPSKYDIDKLEANYNKYSSKILRKLTELCYDLLKIQIPFFSKKMKDSSSNLRMIIDIYCKYPKPSTKIVRTPLDIILLKNKAHITKPADKFITSVYEMKNIHNEYNNLYYWANDFVANCKEKGNEERLEEELLMSLKDCDKWLEDNIWRYYD